MYKYCPRCKTKLIRKIFRKGEPTRLFCPDCHFVHYNNSIPTVSGLFIKNGKLLFSQRGIKPLKNYWDLPGGFIESAEPPDKALAREMKEELNVKITGEKYLNMYIDKYQAKDEKYSTLNIYYLVKYSGQLKAKDDVKNIKWFPLAKPPKKIAFKYIYKVLRDLKIYDAKTK